MGEVVDFDAYREEVLWLENWRLQIIQLGMESADAVSFQEWRRLYGAPAAKPGEPA